MTAGRAAGVLLGSLSAGAISRAFTPQEIADHAWRLPFLAGGIFCLPCICGVGCTKRRCSPS